MGLVMMLCTLGYGVSIAGTLVDELISTCVCGGGVDSIIDILRDVCVFACACICVIVWYCLVGDVLLASGAWRMNKLLADAASCSRSLIDVSPFPFYIPLADFLRLQIALTTQSICVIVGFVIFLCWKTTLSNTCSALVFLTLYTWS